MSSTLREASKDTLQAKDKTYHYYSIEKVSTQCIKQNGYSR